MEALKTHCINSQFDYIRTQSWLNAIYIYIFGVLVMANYMYSMAKIKTIYLYLEVFLLESRYKRESIWDWSVYKITNHFQGVKRIIRDGKLI